MTKKVAFPAKPISKAANDWVANKPEVEVTEPPATEPPKVKEEQPKEEMKRLTIDIPESLHRTIKSQCAIRGTKIVDEVREMLLQKYSNA